MKMKEQFRVPIQSEKIREQAPMSKILEKKME